MTAQFTPSRYPGGRIVLMSGSVRVAAIFPPPHRDAKWRWMLLQMGTHWAREGYAQDEAAARKAARAAWQKFLDQAKLREVTS